jgi:copper chaperone CopZ
VSVALNKLDGIEKVVVSLNEGAATLTLKPGNRITVEQVREIIRKNGFDPKDAKVRATGTVVARDGTFALQVSGTGVTLPLVLPSGGGGFDPGKDTGKEVEVSGQIPETQSPKGGQVIVVTAWNPRSRPD